MEYDANGIRRTKQIPSGNNAGTTTYVYNGSNLVYEKQELSNKLNCKYFLYNNQGIIGFVYNTTTYMFRKNLFGDITAIYRGNTKVAEYRYDAWGNCTIVNEVGNIGFGNPFRYRGYYWDNDLNLYYLMSRYYDPQTGRFISPARVASLNPQVINGLNLYSYANNTPIGIAYSSSSVYGSSAGGKVSSLGGVIPQNSAVINNQFTWPNLDFLGTGFGYIENTFSMVAGVVDGVRKIKHLDKLVGLDKASNRLMRIGILINVGLSFYNNLTNSSLTGAQRAGNIVGDIVYIGVSSFATWGLSALTAMIAGIGPFVAPIVGFGVGVVLDQFWHGEDILGIDGFAFNPSGQSIDEWIKEWLTNLFGG